MRGRRGERELLLLLGAPPLPLEAARGRRLRALLRLGLPRVAVVRVGGEFEDVVGRGDGGQVGAVPEANFQIFIRGDTARWFKHTVDFKAKVLLCPGLL